MSIVNRRYIDKHWLTYVLRGSLASLFGLLMVFNGLNDSYSIGLPIGIFLLCMGAIDSVSAIYSSHKKHGWINALLDAIVDVIAALTLLFVGRDNLVASVVILAIYTLVSGVIDLCHSFVSTVDPTDRFIRTLIGAFGCIIGIVILNAGGFDVIEFYRFFGVYVLIVGVTSLIYGAHNRAQIIEAREMMHELAQEHLEKTLINKDKKSAKTGHSKKSDKSVKAEKAGKAEKAEKTGKSDKSEKSEK